MLHSHCLGFTAILDAGRRGAVAVDRINLNSIVSMALVKIAKHPPDSFLRRRQYCGMGRDPWSSGNKTFN
eukprot:scaffold25896_cov228-Skeletonema_marinoi.AAC.2